MILKRCQHRTAVEPEYDAFAILCPHTRAHRSSGIRDFPRIHRRNSEVSQMVPSSLKALLCSLQATYFITTEAVFAGIPRITSGTSIHPLLR